MTVPKVMVWAGVTLLTPGCDGPGEPEAGPGSLLVSVSTIGGTFDQDGYDVELDGVKVDQVGLQENVEIAELGAWQHTVALGGVASNCRVIPPLSRNVLIAPAQQATAAFTVRCDSLLRNAIVFARIHDRTSTIYWTSPQGSPPMPIIEGSGPTVSPDGSRIVFERFTSLWSAKVDGDDDFQLTFSGTVNQMPQYSPDGQRIAFVSDRDGNFEIYTMRADGTDQRRVTTDPAQDTGPHWSPDGTRLAFTRSLPDPGGNTEVFLINADGTGEVNVTRHPDGDEAQGWAPHGDRLLINSSREWLLSNEIFTIDLDGLNAVNLTNHEAVEGSAAWSPAGDAIVFTSERIDHIHSLYRADAAGQGVVRLTTPAVNQLDVSPTWIP